MAAVSNPETISDEERKENLGRAIGRIATGVYVITLEHDGKFEGMLTSWLCQAGFEPPMLTLAVKKERPVLASLGAGAKFVVNVLSKNNMDVFKNFAKPHEEGLDRFAGLKVCNDCDAGPVFTDAVAYMACKVDKQVEAGDHYVIVAEIVEGKVFTSEQEPMVHLRKSGFHY